MSTTTEWLAVGAVVAALVGAAGSAVPSVAGSVTSKLCVLVGGACAEEAEAAAEPPDLEPGPFDEVPGTRDERDRTSTPRPPAGDQCSHSPDVLGSLYDFSYACYGHDICWQLGTLGGRAVTTRECNARFLSAMQAHCDRRHGAGSRRGRQCRAVARTYWVAVSAAGAHRD